MTVRDSHAPDRGENDLRTVLASDERAPADLDALIRTRARADAAMQPAVSRRGSGLRRALPIAAVVVLSIGVVPLVLRDNDRLPAEESIAAPAAAPAPVSSRAGAATGATASAAASATGSTTAALSADSSAAPSAVPSADLVAAEPLARSLNDNADAHELRERAPLDSRSGEAFALEDQAIDALLDESVADDDLGSRTTSAMLADVLALLRRGDRALAEQRYAAWRDARDVDVELTLPAELSDDERAWFDEQDGAARERRR